MPLLDIATAQVSSQAHLVPLRALSFLQCKSFSSPFTCSDVKRLLLVSRSLDFQKRIYFCDSSRRLVVKAVATFEPKSIATKKEGLNFCGNTELDANSNPTSTQTESFNSDSEEMDERERLRRMRISKANKGNTPWNKGRKHSAETLKRIRERTRLAMQDPKIKQKLANLGHAQSKETREKIGVGVRIGWQKRREKQMVQERCLFEWQNLIAEASRSGFAGEEELQWDSYQILSEKLDVEWVESIEQRKTMARPKGSKRAPKSAEQRRKIAEAIAAKWADPEYRERVCSGLSRYHGTPVGGERKPRRKPSGTTQPRKRDHVKKKVKETDSSTEEDDISPTQRLRQRRGNKPSYKDPMASSKLEMIKNIRAQRATAETKKIEAINRARLLIAEAQKAAKALEIAATMSLTARASLTETRRLIAEAVESIQSIDAGNDTPLVESLTTAELTGEVRTEIEVVDGEGSNSEQMGEVNGTKMLPQSADKDIMDSGSLTNFTLHDMLNGGQELLLAYGRLSSLNGKHLLEEKQLEANGSNARSENKIPQPNGLVVVQRPSKSKKWIRGRLVEVSEED